MADHDFVPSRKAGGDRWAMPGRWVRVWKPWLQVEGVLLLNRVWRRTRGIYRSIRAESDRSFECYISSNVCAEIEGIVRIVIEGRAGMLTLKLG